MYAPFMYCCDTVQGVELRETLSKVEGSEDQPIEQIRSLYEQLLHVLKIPNFLLMLYSLQ